MTLALAPWFLIVLKIHFNHDHHKISENLCGTCEVRYRIVVFLVRSSMVRLIRLICFQHDGLCGVILFYFMADNNLFVVSMEEDTPYPAAMQQNDKQSLKPTVLVDDMVWTTRGGCADASSSYIIHVLSLTSSCMRHHRIKINRRCYVCIQPWDVLKLARMSQLASLLIF